MQDIKQQEEKRIWIFIAYKDEGLPMFSKLFDDHLKLKQFSAKHSSQNKSKFENYYSTYLDLTDKSFLQSEISLAVGNTINKSTDIVAKYLYENNYDLCIEINKELQDLINNK